MIPRPLALVIVTLVSLVWAANFFGQFLIEGYQPDIAINGIFMVVVGGALMASRKTVPPGQDGDDEPELPEGVQPPPGLDQARAARKAIAQLIDPPPADGRSRHRRGAG